MSIKKENQKVVQTRLQRESGNIHCMYTYILYCYKLQRQKTEGERENTL